MPRLTPGNRLYFYQLLSVELGRGQQVSLARAEEVLDADGLAPRDVGCEAWRELLEQLDEFIRVTVFKRGRAYVTVVVNEAYDELLERAARSTEKSAGKTKSFKRKKGGKDLKPERPRQVPEPVAAEPEPDPETEPEKASPQELEAELELEASFEDLKAPEHELVEKNESDAESSAKAGMAAGPMSELEAEPCVERPSLPERDADTVSESEPETKTDAKAAPKPGFESISEPEPEPEPEPEAETEPESALVSEPTPELEPASPPEPTISLTITFDPRMEEPKEPVPILEPDPAPPLTLLDVPKSISSDVIVNDSALVALSDVFPFGSDVLGILDEDLIQARSTHTFSGTRALVELPLRYALPDGNRLVVRLKRKAPNRAGKRWSLQVPESLPETGVEGLPDAGLWPWSKLPSVRSGVRPYVELARSVETGSWDDLLDQLKELAPSERMSAPQLAAATAAAFMDGALLYAPDGSEAAFALPIASDASTPVAMHLQAQSAAVPWRVKGLVAAETLPEPLNGVWPTSHVSALDQVIIQPRSVLDARSVCAGDEWLEASAQKVFSRAQIRPRVAVVAFDPIAQAPLLLLPIGQEVLAIAPSGEFRYRALAILTREEAHAIACV